MDAFVSSSPLCSSRTFITGGKCVGREMVNRKVNSAIKHPKLPSVPVAPVVKKEPQMAQLGFGRRGVMATSKASDRSARKAFRGGLPKFYNSKTAQYVFSAQAIGQGGTAYDVRVGVSGKRSTNERLNDQQTFRNMDLYTAELIWARPNWDVGEANTAVNMAIKNIMGNANLFESELAELSAPISCAKETGDMKEFIRALGLSNAYRTRFFEPCSNTRFVEMNFKHFLGRAPRSQEEFSEHIRIITEEGYNAEINSYMDSAEYDSLWGRTRVPAVNFRGGHPCNNDMNRTAVLNGSFSNSDRVTKKGMLSMGNIADLPPYSVYGGLPEAWRGENKVRDAAGPIMFYPDNLTWNAGPPGIREAELKWIARLGNWTKFYYKDSAVFKEVMTPVMKNTDEEVVEADAVLKYGSLMAKNFVGSRKTFDMAPVIELRPPRRNGGDGGFVRVQLREIAVPIPNALVQKV